MSRGARPQRALDAPVRAVLGPDLGRTLILACSGGPDSIGLAALLDRLVAEDGGTLVLAHVDHGTRASARQDACVVLSAAARLGRRVRIARVRAARDDEATLRDARYAALTSIAREERAVAVVTAHTAEDQTETVLLALFRGAGLRGAGGMRARRDLAPGIALVRPLLGVERAALALERHASGLAYAIDPTNAEERYRRNALRGHLRGLRRDFPHLDRAVARFAARAAEASGDAADDAAARDRAGDLQR